MGQLKTIFLTLTTNPTKQLNVSHFTYKKATYIVFDDMIGEYE